MNIYDKTIQNTYEHDINMSAVYTRENISSEPVVHSSAAFAKGQIIKGQITDIKGSSVTITLSDSSVVTAYAEDLSSLSIGQRAVFEVTHSDNTQISLKLLSSDSSNSSSYIITRALENAGLTNNERNTEIVKALLNNHLPISREGILNLLKQTSQYKNASPDTLAIMNRHNIPVNELNSSQLEAYRQHENTLTKGITGYTASLIQTLSESDAPVGLAKAVLGFLNEYDYPAAGSAMPQAAAVSDEHTDVTLTNINHIINAPAEKLFSSDTQNIHSNTSVATVARSETLFSMSEFTQNTISDVVNNINQFVNPENIDISKNVIYTTADNSFYIPSPDNAAELSLLLKSDDYKEFFSEVLLKHFTLSADDIKKPGTVKNYYNRISKELEELESLVKHELPEEAVKSAALKELTEHGTSLKDNLDFMRTLNHMFTYIQLPMKFGSDASHADLYVYKRDKKELSASETVRALIHLDMDRLGALDIHITLRNRYLDVGFYAADPSSAPLISSNVTLLEQSLERKGFSLNTSIHILDKKPDPVKDYLLKDEPVSDIKRFTFDKRA